MNIFVDLDNTLCETQDSNYTESKPIKERITKVNKLKDDGNKITHGASQIVEYRKSNNKKFLFKFKKIQ